MAFQRERDAFRNYLEEQEYPRLQMMLMVSGAGLYRHLRKTEPSGFLGTAIRLTFTPFLVVGILMVAAGWGLQAFAPEARTLKGAYEHWVAR